MFDFKTNCIFCGKNVTWGKKSDVRNVTQEFTQLKILPYVLDEVKGLVNHGQMLLGAKYHKFCYPKFVTVSVDDSLQTGGLTIQEAGSANPVLTALVATGEVNACIETTVLVPAVKSGHVADESFEINSVHNVLQQCDIETIPNDILNKNVPMEVDLDVVHNDVDCDDNQFHAIDMNSDNDDVDMQFDDDAVVDVARVDDTNASIQFVCNDVPLDIGKQCACCRRVESEQIKLNLKLVRGKFKRKRFGLHSCTADSLVLCFWCSNYLSVVVRQKSKQQ